MLHSDDELFNNALSAFTKTIQNLLRDREEEFRKRLFEVNEEKGRLALDHDLKTGHRTVIDRVGIRITLCMEHAPKVGEGFLNAFDSIIKPHCRIISNPSKAVLTDLLSAQYLALIARQELAFRKLVLSMGRGKDFEGVFLPVQSTYQNALSKYYDRLDAEIEKHNLELSVQKPLAVQRVKTSEQSIDQDDMIDKFKAACEKRNLVKYKTIPPDVLYKISKEVGIKNLPDFKQFKNRNPAYHEARQYASLTHYAKKRNREEQT